MNILPKIYTLKDEVQTRLYEWFDKEIRPLPKKADGKIDPRGEGLVDNDVDALRHAFVSGVYVLEYSEQTSEMMGRLNELVNFDYSPSVTGSENMDLWNNEVGRKIAKKVKTRRELYELLLKAMKQGELIITPMDRRQYKGEKRIKRMPKSFVIKIKENKTGANVEFLDVRRRFLMGKEEFMHAIRQGKYPGYAIRKHSSGEFPYSIRELSPVQSHMYGSNVAGLRSRDSSRCNKKNLDLKKEISCTHRKSSTDGIRKDSVSLIHCFFKVP